MQNKKSVILFTLLSSWLWGTAATVSIEGQAPAYSGKEIAVFTYLDQFTRTLALQDVTIVDSTGAFHLDMDIDQIHLINLRCDYVNAHIYIQPGAQYDIIFPSLSPGQSKSINNTTYVDVIFNNLSEGDINEQIIAFNQEYKKFFSDNLQLLAKIAMPVAAKDSTKKNTHSKSSIQRYGERLETFAIRMDSLFPDHDNTFIYLYRKSVEADMFRNAYTPPRKIYDRYIRNVPIQINHPEQVVFLQGFYDNYLKKLDAKFGLDALQVAINGDNPLENSLAVFAKDDFLEDPELREIVFSYTMYGAWNSHALDPAKVLELLQSMAAKGSTAQTRTLAYNLYQYLNKDMIGASAYNYQLVNMDGSVDRLTDHKGKYVVLEFWATWCTDCLQEIVLTDRFVDQYKDQFDFISISVDDDKKKMDDYIKDHPELSQKFLHMAQDKLILDQYNIRSLPAYIVIDEASRILIPHAPFPSQVLEKHLHKLSMDKKEEMKDNFYTPPPHK